MKVDFSRWENGNKWVDQVGKRKARVSFIYIVTWRETREIKMYGKGREQRARSRSICINNFPKHRY